MTFLLALLLTFHVHALEREPASLEHPGDPDYISPVVRTMMPTEGSKVLTVMSWNVKHLGRKGFVAAKAAPLLKDADVVTLQEVNAGPTGVEALNEIAAELERLTQERICKAYSEKPSGGKERYGYLWKDRRIAFVKKNGDILDRCPTTALTMRLGVKNAQHILREPALGILFFRPEARSFVLASIHLRPSGKKPQEEVEPLFATLAKVLLPTIVAGDFNLDSTHSAFSAARARDFQPAMRGVKTSLKMKKRELSKPYDNFWYRKLKLKSTKVTNLHQAFPTMEPKEIYKSLSDHCPITGEFEFIKAAANDH